MKAATNKFNDPVEESINSTEKFVLEGIPSAKLYEVIEEIILYKRMTLITAIGIVSIMAIAVMYLF